jgi:spore germination protein
MYKRISAVLLPVLALFLIGAAVWGYQENQEKNAILIKAENQYQRSFHDLTYHVNTLQDELSKAQVVASDGGTRKCLINVWRLSSEALSESNQLPLNIMSFHKTKEFLSDVSKFTYRVAIRDLSSEPLSSEEKKALKALNQEAQAISTELATVRAKVLDQHLRWMDVEIALASEDQTMDNTIVQGFQTIDEGVSQFTETNWNPTMANVSDQDQKSLKGPKMSKEQVKEKVAQFLGIQSTQNINITETGQGTDYLFYSVTARRNGEEDTVNMDVSPVGGHVLWMMDHREIGPVRLNMEQAEEEALEFAQDHDLNNMVSVNIDQYDNVAVFTLAPRQGEVVLYPDTAVIKVALDNGEIIGYQARDYVYNHKKRNLAEPAISKEEAEGKVNGGLKIVSSDLALIENDMKKEILVYEFIGKMNDQLFRVFINAEDGQEENVEKLKMVDADTDPGKNAS